MCVILVVCACISAFRLETSTTLRLLLIRIVFISLLPCLEARTVTMFRTLWFPCGQLLSGACPLQLCVALARTLLRLLVISTAIMCVFLLSATLWMLCVAWFTVWILFLVKCMVPLPEVNSSMLCELLASVMLIRWLFLLSLTV